MANTINTNCCTPVIAPNGDVIAKEVIGQKQVNSLIELFALSPDILSIDPSEGLDANGLVWYVTEEDTLYLLVDFNKYTTNEGWAPVDYAPKYTNMYKIDIHVNSLYEGGLSDGTLKRPYKTLVEVTEFLQAHPEISEVGVIIHGTFGGFVSYNDSVTIPANILNFVIKSDGEMAMNSLDIVVADTTTPLNILIHDLSYNLDIQSSSFVININSPVRSLNNVKLLECRNSNLIVNAQRIEVLDIMSCAINSAVVSINVNMNLCRLISSYITAYEARTGSGIYKQELYNSYITSYNQVGTIKPSITLLDSSISAFNNLNNVDVITKRSISKIPLHYVPSNTTTIEGHLDGLDTAIGNLGAPLQDWKVYEYIYRLTNTNTHPVTPPTSQVDGYVPPSWSGTPLNISEANQYQWISTRFKQNGEWSFFTAPTLWAKYGVAGTISNWVSFVFKQSAVLPDKPTSTTPIPHSSTGWVDAPTSTGIWWMSKSVINGSTNVAGTWSDPVKVTGEDGIDGAYVDFKFAKNTSSTSYPSIVLTDRYPTGWVDAPPTLGEGEFLWMTNANIDANNALVGTWSVPVRISGEKGEDGKDGKDGEDGLNGTTPDWFSFVFKLNSTQPALPTGTNPNPPLANGWVDAPTPTGIWWMSKTTVNGPSGLAGSWSTPVKVTATDGSSTRYKYAKNTSQTSPPALVNSYRNPAGWSDVPVGLTPGSDEYLWMISATINPDNTLFGTWSAPVRISGENGLNGLNGNAGPILIFLGEYSASESYIGNNNVINAVKNPSDGLFYMTKTTAGSFSGIPPTNKTKWSPFEGLFKSIATDLLLAANANIAGWIFKITGDGDSILLSSNGASVLNGTTGDITATGTFSTKPGSNYRLDLSGSTIDVYSLDNSASVGNVKGVIVGSQIDSSGTISYSPSTEFRSKWGSTSNFKATGTNISGTNGSGRSILIDWCENRTGSYRNYLVFILKDLPTTNPSVAGQLWNDNGTLKISS